MTNSLLFLKISKDIDCVVYVSEGVIYSSLREKTQAKCEQGSKL